MSDTEENQPKKQKFVFNCTKCGVCCEKRGPIPLVMNDLVMWAKNGVVANMMPYIKFIKTPQGGIDLVLSQTDQDPYAFLKKEGEKPSEEAPKADLKCPLYNDEAKECTAYDNRPLSCRTYPLEYDGQKYLVVNAEECPGIGHGEMTKDARIAMRDLAKEMNRALTEMRVAMPVLSQAFQPFVLQGIIEAQQKFEEELSKMPPEEQARIRQQMMDQQK